MMNQIKIEFSSSLKSRLTSHVCLTSGSSPFIARPSAYPQTRPAARLKSKVHLDSQSQVSISKIFK